MKWRIQRSITISICGLAIAATGCSAAYGQVKRELVDNAEVEFVIVRTPILDGGKNAAGLQATGKFSGMYLSKDYDAVAETSADYFSRAFPDKKLVFNKNVVNLPMGRSLREVFRSEAETKQGHMYKLVSVTGAAYSWCSDGSLCICPQPYVVFVDLTRFRDPEYREAGFSLATGRCWTPDEAASIRYDSSGNVAVSSGGIPAEMIAGTKGMLEKKLPDILGKIQQAEIPK